MKKDCIQDDKFVQLFEDFYETLVRIVLKICGRMDIAEELCQEAFLRYFERRRTLPNDIQVRYWLIRVVKNLALTYEKRRIREIDVVRRFAHIQGEESYNEGVKKVLCDETQKHVQKALLLLPYKLRIVLILKEYAGYTYSDIARILKISESNVKVRVHRARKHLAGLISKGDLHVP